VQAPPLGGACGGLLAAGCHAGHLLACLNGDNYTVAQPYLLPGAENADESGVGGADGRVWKSPVRWVLDGAFVGVVSPSSARCRHDHSSRISLTAARAAFSSTREVFVAGP
jgi:hypothetical protein